MQSKYSAVYDELVARIAKLSPGAKLDSELTIARQLDVSPMTVRRALELLAQEGKTVGIPGKGTFVAAQPKDAVRDGLIEKLERVHSLSLYTGGLGPATEAEADKLGIASKTFVYRVAQQREDEDGVAGWDLSILATDPYPDLLSQNLGRTVRACLEGAFRAELYAASLEVQTTCSDVQASGAGGSHGDEGEGDLWAWFDEVGNAPGLIVDHEYVDSESDPLLLTRTILLDRDEGPILEF
ncbi:MAG TPA: GntR family transcriptional regulator [Actinomyces sp.]|jgi:GntR family transcriptional regulator|nr:GntR family transcriptional regulator [Actinomyces sp.]